MYWLLIGSVSSIAVSRRLPKKKPTWITRQRLALSIFSTSALNLALPAFSPKMLNLRISRARKNTGATIEMTKNAYEKKVAI